MMINKEVPPHTSKPLDGLFQKHDQTLNIKIMEELMKTKDTSVLQKLPQRGILSMLSRTNINDVDINEG